jgi:hypothetical protein
MRQPEPSAEGSVDYKPQDVDSVYHMAIITDLTDYISYVLDALDQKENIQNIPELHSLFGENMYESSNRSPVFSDTVHPCQSIKLESKSDINTVKKEDSMGICNGAEGSSAHPPPNCNATKMQGFLRATRWHQTSSSSSVNVQEKAVSSAPSKINDKFIWRSKLDATRLKMKIWREVVKTSQAAVQNQSRTKRKL